MRFLHRLYAGLMGYFWMPCPVCRRPFGGHEWYDHNTVELGNGLGIGVCSTECAERGRRVTAIVKANHEADLSAMRTLMFSSSTGPKTK